MMIYFKIILKEKYSQKKKSEGRNKKQNWKMKLYDRYINISVLSSSLFLCVSEHFHNKKFKKKGGKGREEGQQYIFYLLYGENDTFPTVPLCNFLIYLIN